MLRRTNRLPPDDRSNLCIGFDVDQISQVRMCPRRAYGTGHNYGQPNDQATAHHIARYSRYGLYGYRFKSRPCTKTNIYVIHGSILELPSSDNLDRVRRRISGPVRGAQLRM